MGVVLLTQDIRESQVRVPKKLWKMGMGGRRDRDGVRCRNMNRRKPGISREVLRDRDGESCAQERWQLSGEKLGSLGWGSLPGNLSLFSPTTMSWGQALFQHRNQNVLGLLTLPQLGLFSGLSSCSCSLPPFGSVHPLLRMPIGDLCSPPFSDFLRLYFP